MSDNASGDSSSFSRAFLPGLILGLVVGGLCGAVLPDLLGGAGPAGVGGSRTVSDRDPNAPQEIDGVLVDRDGIPIEEATEPATDAAGNAAGDAANAIEGATDSATDTTSEGG